jgi:hypothetical protein
MIRRIAPPGPWSEDADRCAALSRREGDRDEAPSAATKRAARHHDDSIKTRKMVA